MLFEKHIYIIAGHYGAGKSNLAVNLALQAKREGRETVLVDLDIVNPFFRSADCKEMLKASGISVIVPPFANTGADLPVLSGEIDAVLRQREKCVILDVGGDDAGAAALGRYAPKIQKEDYEMLYVIQQKRFLTGSTEQMEELLHEIENASHLKTTGIINNTNLSDQTVCGDIIQSFSYADELCGRTGLPLFATTVRTDIAKSLEVQQERKITPIEIYISCPV